MAAFILIQNLSFCYFIFLIAMDGVNGHGFMSVPPMRSAMWNYGFPTPTNNDNTQLFCGGVGVQYNDVNQGRCGECGDTWSDPRPRANDEGGKYGKGIIVANYIQEQAIDIKIQVTANHGGFFEFRLCADKTSPSDLTTDECFNKHLLQFEDGTTRYILGATVGGPSALFNFTVRLPAGVSCQYCVLQWWWKTASNNNGCAGNDIGCGEQEQYKNCADVAIVANGAVSNVTKSPDSFISTVSTNTVGPTCPSYDNNTFICVCGSSVCQLQEIGNSSSPAGPFACPLPAGLFPNPNNVCSSNFYSCANGNSYLMSCPPGLAFNPKSLRCDYPKNVPGCA